ncbi:MULTISPECIES: dTMP kinase [unclassified Massilia]|uniref:dTMP kinase n=1 Tax=unclassified Massilia TaxID=2609279 RepID=UPI001786B11B|nr:MULTISPECIES: dTMP kinase [unclassified Massilia]MBD8529205.1 dTMP kinase [Massilia sp. CFBP 13647]MBD8672599.1 dTMP kinase [Massilia sp. CFBP 13721]
MSTYDGILIAIDGIDGAGKTTQVHLLRSAFEQIGETVVISKEPTDGKWGQKLRDSALNGRLPFDEELDLFIRDRQDHLKNKIIPALEAGNIVILDRYFYSTIAYQGILVENPKTIVERIRANVLEPDAAFWLDLPADLAVNRVTARDGKPNLFEKQEDLAKAGEIFRSIAEVDNVLQRLDATMAVQFSHHEIIQKLIAGAVKTKRCRKAYGCDEPISCTPRLTGSCEWWNTVQKLNSLPIA